jgi:hypothetical protein
MLAGVLFAVWGYLHRGGASARVDAIVGALGIVVPLLFLVGLSGFYAWSRGRVALRLGQIGFILSCIAAGLGIVYRVMELSGTADAADRFSYLAGKGWTPQLFDWLPWLFTGLVLLGIASTWTGPVRRRDLLPLAMGLLGWAYYLSDSGSMVQMRLAHILCAGLFSLCWIVLGYFLWSEGTRTVAAIREGKTISEDR